MIVLHGNGSYYFIDPKKMISCNCKKNSDTSKKMTELLYVDPSDLCRKIEVLESPETIERLVEKFLENFYKNSCRCC
jgi:hypothetical protein